MNTDRDTKTANLVMEVAKLIHPIVSPYDLSEQNLKANYYNNVAFYGAVQKIVSFIESHVDNPSH